VSLTPDDLALMRRDFTEAAAGTKAGVCTLGRFGLALLDEIELLRSRATKARMALDGRLHTGNWNV